MLGSELAGRIAADSPIPDGCPFRRGDRVFGAAQGAYGETVAAPWQALVALPDSMSFDQGAGASCCVCAQRAGREAETAAVSWGGALMQVCT